MDSIRNQREFSRVSTEILSEISGPGLTKFQGRTRNVSMKGIFVDGKFSQALAGKVCQIVLHLMLEGNGVCIEATGQVARVDRDGIGIEFTEILGLESHEHLRNLVRYNASGDINQVENELSDHIGLKHREQDQQAVR